MLGSFQRLGRWSASARVTALAPALLAVALAGCTMVASTIPSARAVARGRDAGGASPQIVFFGDSITYGYGSDDDRCEPATLGSDCYADVTTYNAGAYLPALDGAREVNMGVVGSCLVPTHTPHSVCSKAVSGEARLASFAANCAGARDAVILFGANDALDFGVTIPAFERVLSAAAVACHRAGVAMARVLIGQTTFRPRTSNAILQRRIAELDAAEAHVAHALGATLALTFAPLQRCGKPCFFDWVHPNSRGHRLLADAFLRAIATAK